MNVAVILAGGVGARVGADRPKQFIDVLGKPVLAYTIECFQNHPEIDAIEVVCHTQWKNFLNDMIEQYGFNKVKWVADGGETFQESVLNGINYLNDKVSRDDIVLVHFGASPFIKDFIISDCIRVCKEKGNAISTTDYYLLSGEKHSTNSVDDPENFSEKYINRETIAYMNTPHAFKYGFVKDLYDEAIESGAISEVEPHTTTLMYKMGKKVYFAKGSQLNIKITRKEDLDLFEGYLLQREQRISAKTSADAIVLFADGFEESEGLLIVDLLRRAGISTVTASIGNRRNVVSSRGISVLTDSLVGDVDFDGAKILVLPGGRRGTVNLQQNDIVKEQCIRFAEKKMIAAICAAPSILADLGLLDGREATCHPDYEAKMKNAIITGKKVSVSDNIITGQGLGATIPMTLEVIRLMVGNDIADKIKKEICFYE